MKEQGQRGSLTCSRTHSFSRTRAPASQLCCINAFIFSSIFPHLSLYNDSTWAMRIIHSELDHCFLISLSLNRDDRAYSRCLTIKTNYNSFFPSYKKTHCPLQNVLFLFHDTNRPMRTITWQWDLRRRHIRDIIKYAQLVRVGERMLWIQNKEEK